MPLSPRLLRSACLFAAACAAPWSARAADAAPLVVPDWALPGSATHQQVPPPAGFSRATVTFAEPLGVFTGVSDIGGPLLPGRSSFDAGTGAYTITSASYNIWYFRDEFRYVWKQMDGDVSLAADVSFPVADGYFDRKAVFVIRQDLDDNAKEIMSALHGGGLIHLALRDTKGGDLREAEHVAGEVSALRLGIQKQGNAFTLWLGPTGGPMHQVGEPVELAFDGPFYVGLGFCSHDPRVADTTVLTHVVLEPAAGRLH